MQVTFKECHLTLLCVQRHLVMPAPLRDACDGFMHGRLGNQLARMATDGLLRWQITALFLICGEAAVEDF